MKGSLGILLSALAGCGGTAPDPSTPPLVARMIDDGGAPPDDLVEVWVCHVPDTTTAPIYGDLPLRQPLDPAMIVGQIGGRAADYWRSVSSGRYELSFAAGGAFDLADDEDDADCLARALDRSGPDATVVLAIADAEHAEGEFGGRGNPGNAPNCGGCAAAATRRGVSIGASDFHPDWGPVPLLDLIEHELGHTLGLPHSGEPGADVYSSGLDVMSDSAAPRLVDPARRDGPSTLAINLVDLGWLDLDDVVVFDGSGGDLELVPVNGDPGDPDLDGARLVVLAVDDHRVLTVEYRTATGFDAHLPGSGIAVHLVDDSAGTAIERSQVPVHTARPPHTDLLGAGTALTTNGWTIEVVEVGATARLAIAPTDR